MVTMEQQNIWEELFDLLLRTTISFPEFEGRCGEKVILTPERARSRSPPTLRLTEPLNYTVRRCHHLLIQLCYSFQTDRRREREGIERTETWKKTERRGGSVAWLAKQASLQLVAADSLEFHFRWTHQLPTDWQGAAMDRKCITGIAEVVDK